MTTAKAPVLLQGTTPELITKIIDIAPEQRTPEQKQTLANHYRGVDADLGRLERSYREYLVPSSPRAPGGPRLGVGAD